MEPRQPQEIEPGDLGDAAILARDAVLVEYREIQPAEIEPVAGCPDDGRDTRRRQVEIERFRGLEVVSRTVVRRRIDAFPLDEQVDRGPEPLVEETVGSGEASR